MSVRSRLGRITAALGLVAVVAAAPLAVGAPAAHGAVAGLGYLVEDYVHPGASEITAERGITVGNGSGSIFLDDCAVGTGQLEVETLYHSEPLCFTVVGNGWLDAEVTGSFGVGAGDGQLTVTSYVPGSPNTSLIVPPNQRRGVGAVDGQSVVVELVVSGYTGSGRAPAPTDTPTGERAYAAKITTGTAACSGALISPRWLVTTASCFTASPKDYSTLTPGTPPTPSRAWFGLDESLPPENTGYSITHVEPFTGSPGRDLALVQLNKPVTGVMPVALPTTAPANGAAAVFTGWGRNAQEWTPWASKTQNLTITATGALPDAQGQITMLPATGTAFCAGDAGAPIVTGTVNAPVLAGVASQAGGAGCFWSGSTDTTSIASRVDDVLPWIYAHVIANP